MPNNRQPIKKRLWNTLHDLSVLFHSYTERFFLYTKRHRDSSTTEKETPE